MARPRRDTTLFDIKTLGTFTVPFNRVVTIRELPHGEVRHNLRKFVGIGDTLFVGNHSTHQGLIEAAHAEKFLEGHYPPSIQGTKESLIAAGELHAEALQVSTWKSVGYIFETPAEHRQELHKLLFHILALDRKRPERHMPASS